MGSQISILRELDPEAIADRRRSREFFWADLDLTRSTSAEIAGAFGLDAGEAEAIGRFTRASAPSQKVYVGDDLIIFRFWCLGRPDAGVLGGDAALEAFQINVVLHGDYLLTVSQQPYDVPGEIGEGRIPPGRSERYAVYLALGGILGTVLEALSNIELAIDDIETDLLRGRSKRRAQEVARIGSLRDQLTGLRMRIGPELGLFGRVTAEIDHIQGLEGDSEAYFQRIEQLLDRVVDRIDAASAALSHVLEIGLNETTAQLTIVATIFLPLTFIVGFFGMNFKWMVDAIDSKSDFLIYGIGTWLVPLALALLYVAVRDLWRRSQAGPPAGR